MASAPALDEQTIVSIRRSLAAAGAGRMDEACQIATEALGGGGDAAALNALLGSLHLGRGDSEAAFPHLREAHALRPSDPVVALNLASILAARGSYEEAAQILPVQSGNGDAAIRAERLRGYIAQGLGDFAGAAEAYERVVAAAPRDWETWNNLGNARRATGDSSGALGALQKAIRLNPQAAPVRLNYATALVWAREFEQAEEELRSMARDFPDDWRALRELHLLLLQIGREDDATEPLQEAGQRDPTNIELTLGLAAHLLARQRSAEAEQMYRRAVALDPHNTTAYLGIATTFDLMNRLEDLARLVEEAESAGISAAGLSFIRAYHHHRSKRYKQGLEELLQVPEDLETARRQQLLGQLLQANGDYDGAFAAFERMNALMREDPSQPDERGAIFRNMIREQLRSLTPEWVNSWSKTEIDERDSPVFLVGFPRSGTTLLDTILMSHPSVEVLEEEPMLARAAEALGGFAAIASASPDQLAEARNVYFGSARFLTPLKPGNLLIDKNPLSMNNLPMIRRLFPDAKIILALRHPCDVVLSCFVTNFKLNNGMASFLKLETAAELYDLSFSYFERACQLLAPPVHKILYENVVADLDRELRPLLEFLELPWDERVLDHQSTARSRGHIKTASYSQVVEPIYTRSSGRWRNYRSHLEPIFPVLKPWIDKFGYEL